MTTFAAAAVAVLIGGSVSVLVYLIGLRIVRGLERLPE